MAKDEKKNDRKYVEGKSKDVEYCPSCKRAGDHAQWCSQKNRPGLGGKTKHAPD